jgi:hypothetical protein
MGFEAELDLYLRARYTLIVIVTIEEERALRAVTSVCERGRRPCLAWDLADGFEALHGSTRCRCSSGWRRPTATSRSC